MTPRQGRKPRARGRGYSPGPARAAHGREQTPPFASVRKSVGSGGQFRHEASVDSATRNPMLSFRLSGLLVLRYAHRTFLAVLLKAPPRSTRALSGLPPPRAALAGRE
jgi:hypothetical protein